MSNITRKVVAITGASSGIGEATARLLAAAAPTSWSVHGAPRDWSAWLRPLPRTAAQPAFARST